MSMLQLHVVLRNSYEFLNVEMSVQSMPDADSANCKKFAGKKKPPACRRWRFDSYAERTHFCVGRGISLDGGIGRWPSSS